MNENPKVTQTDQVPSTPAPQSNPGVANPSAQATASTNAPRPAGENRGPRSFGGPSAGGNRDNNRNRPSGNFGNQGTRGPNDRRNARPGGAPSTPGGANNNSANGQRRNTRPGGPNNRRREEPQESEFDSQVIQVKRVSKSVSGGKIMRFSALVVIGDRKNRVGYGLAKGLDYQDAVAKATRKAKERIIKIDINDDFSLKFPINFKYKSSQIYLKPAQSGTGLIAGGFLRPMLQLAGIQNIYSKIVGSNNKVVGIRSAYELLNESYKIA